MPDKLVSAPAGPEAAIDKERSIIFVVGAVQFVNILDFMIVMPLGPDFAKALGIPLSQLGYVGGSYTAAACVSGIAGAFFLDRYDRKRALLVAMLGLTIGTLAGALAQGLLTLMLARVIAGMFGGPATSLSYSIIADVIPSERRGKAMGAVMGAFSVASVLGVPAGLELARQGTWKLPFLAVAILGAIIAAFAWARLPSMREHLAREIRSQTMGAGLMSLLRRDILLALSLTFTVMASGFVLIPNISAYVLGNLGYPRERLGLLYLAGGTVSFFTMRLVGRLVDRLGAAAVGTIGTCVVSLVVYLGFVRFPPAISVLAIFIAFMFAMSFRNVAYNTLASRVPAAEERARFGSMQSAVQHFAASAAAFTSTQLLTELPDHTLEGIPIVATVTITLSLALIPLFFRLEHRVLAKASLEKFR